MAAQQQAYFKTNEILRDRFKMIKLLGAGAFGQVFLAKDLRDGIDCAIKTEKMAVPKKCLCMEVAVMRDIGNCPHVPFIVACGRTDDCRFIVMECLGKALDSILKKLPGTKKTLSIENTLQITLQSITAIKEVHGAGYIHRDVKPANFAFGKHPKVSYNMFIYDFGLARIHMKDGQPRKRRKVKPGFRGTLRYAALASHFGDELGRADDLIPVFYSAMEIYKGTMPWKGLCDRHQIKELKEKTPMEEMCAGMPHEFIRMGDALYRANYKSQPRYDKLAGLMISALQRLKCDPNRRLDIPGLPS